MRPVPGKGHFSRRRFLQLSATTAGGVVLAAASQPSMAAAASAAPTVAASAAPVLAGPASQATVKLQMWKAPHKPAGEEIKIAEKVLAGLHEANPGIQVEYTEVPWLKYNEQLTAAFASNTPPDITYQTEGIATYAIPGQLEPIDDFLNQQPGLREQYRANAYVPGTIAGKVYGIPWVFAGNSLLWNKDLFEQAGLDPDKPPDTWDQVIEFGLKLTKPDQQQYGLMIGPKTALEFHGWNTVFWPLNAGGRYTNADFTEIYLDEPESIAAANFYGDLFNKHKITPPADMGSVTGQLMSMFTAGQGGFAWEVNTALATIMDTKPSFRVGVGPKPQGPATDPVRARAGYGSVGYLSISKASTSKAEAWTAIKYLAEPEPLKGWVKLLGWQSSRYDTSFAQGDPLIEAVEANIQYSTMVNEYMPDKPYRSDVMNAFLGQYEAIAQGQVSGQDGMIEAAKQARELIAARSA
jgi:ABC-type glycerol-3-phosphate transport system substrate-binding protein